MPSYASFFSKVAFSGKLKEIAHGWPSYDYIICMDYSCLGHSPDAAIYKMDKQSKIESYFKKFMWTFLKIGLKNAFSNGHACALPKSLARQVSKCESVWYSWAALE